MPESHPAAALPVRKENAKKKGITTEKAKQALKSGRETAVEVQRAS